MKIFHRMEDFDNWLSSLKDRIGIARIAQRIDLAVVGNFRDCEPVGGDKSGQKRDIKRPAKMAGELKRSAP